MSSRVCSLTRGTSCNRVKVKSRSQVRGGLVKALGVRELTGQEEVGFAKTWEGETKEHYG